MFYILGFTLIVILLIYAYVSNKQTLIIESQDPQELLIYDSHLEAKRIWCLDKGYKFNANTGACEHTPLTCHNQGVEAVRKSVEEKLDFTHQYTEWSEKLGMCVQSNYAYPVHIYCDRYQRAAKYSNSFIYYPPTYKCIEWNDAGHCSRIDIDQEPECRIMPVYCEDEKQMDYDYTKKTCKTQTAEFIAEAIFGTTVYRVLKKRMKECKHIDCALYFIDFFMSLFGGGVEAYWAPAGEKWVKDIKRECGGDGTFTNCVETNCGDKKLTKYEYDLCIKEKCMHISPSDEGLSDGALSKIISSNCVSSLTSIVETPIAATFNLLATILGFIPGMCEEGSTDEYNPLCSWDNFVDASGIITLLAIYIDFYGSYYQVVVEDLALGMFTGDPDRMANSINTLDKMGVKIDNDIKSNKYLGPVYSEVRNALDKLF